MKLTNNKALPDVIVNAIEKLIYPPHPDANRIAVTSLIAPPIIFQLKRRHWEEISEDASESVWRLLGTSVHKLIESVSDSRVSEQKVEKDFGDITVSGKIDVAEGSELCDYKITSAWKKVFTDGNVPAEWSRQLNVYAYLRGGIKTAKVIVIYRDWSHSKARQDADYPQEPLTAYDVRLAPESDQLGYIVERVALHRQAMSLPDDELPICSPEDRWATETKFAIYKNENKTATRVLGSREEAERLIEVSANGKDKYRIEERAGEDKRCLQYCPVKQWCSYGKNLKEKEMNNGV